MATSAVLQPVREEGWRSGFRNLLRKEMGLWWATKRWWKTALLWFLVLNGIVAIVILAAKTEPEPGEGPLLSVAVGVFFQMGAIANAIAAIVRMQDAVIGEKQLGTAAWILSKPAAREAFVLAKALAHAVSLIVLSVLVPALIFLPEVKFLTGEMPPMLPFLGGVGILALLVLFYQTMALMFGTIFQARGGIIGVGLGFLFAGTMVPNFVPWTKYVTPWALGNLAGSYVGGMPLPAWAPAPIVATAVMIPVFLLVALWRFNQEEL